MKWLIKSAMRALYPTTEHGPGVDRTDLDAFLDQYSREAPTGLYLGLVVGSLVFHATTPFTVRSLRPAFLLKPDALDAHASQVASHKNYVVRQSVMLLKLTAGMCWGADDAVRQGMNLGPYPQDPGTWRTQ